MVEHQADHKEIDGNSDWKDGQRSNFIATPQPKKEVQQHDVQTIVDEMGNAEPHSILGWRLLMESKVSWQPVVDEKAKHIAYTIGNIHFYPFLQQPIGAIVQYGRYCAHNSKTNNLGKRFSCYHGAKIRKKLRIASYCWDFLDST